MVARRRHNRRPISRCSHANVVQLAVAAFSVKFAIGNWVRFVFAAIRMYTRGNNTNTIINLLVRSFDVDIICNTHRMEMVNTIKAVCDHSRIKTTMWNKVNAFLFIDGKHAYHANSTAVTGVHTAVTGVHAAVTDVHISQSFTGAPHQSRSYTSQSLVYTTQSLVYTTQSLVYTTQSLVYTTQSPVYPATNSPVFKLLDECIVSWKGQCM